jgi:hypothetical protein
MKTKSLTGYTDFATMLLTLVTGLIVTLIILSSPFSESVRGNVMGLAETLITNGTMGILILLWLMVDGWWIRFLLAIQLRHVQGKRY